MSHITLSSEIRCLVIGAGKMGSAHLQVLNTLIPNQFAVYAPSENNKKVAGDLGADFFHGKFADAISEYNPTHAIVASPVDILFDNVTELLEAGIKHILVEKPAVLNTGEGNTLKDLSEMTGADIWVGYNRRFYTSIRTALNMIKGSGETISSVSFEFTEVVNNPEGPDKHSAKTRNHWLLANSLHVIDAAFHPVGLPDLTRTQMIVSGGLKWHPSGSIFVGSGHTQLDIPFSYQANWESPGRWGFEWMTSSKRYIFRPMEKLFIMKKGSFTAEEITIDDELDRLYKPGVYNQNMHFLNGNSVAGLVPLSEALKLISLGRAMGGYQQEALP